MADTLPGTPYVESSDLVANYPAVSEDLAERVDLVGIIPFADAAARTVAFPTPTDGQYSYLQDTNRTEFYNGAAWVPTGKVLQVLSTAKVDTFTFTGTSYTEVTGLTVAITPTYSTSKVLVIASIVGQRNNANNGVGAFSLFVGSNNLLAPTSPGTRVVGFSNGVQMGDSNGDVNMEVYHYTFLDSPATTSATTYGVRVRNGGGVQVSYVNRGENDANNDANARGVSTITVMEIA